MPNLFVLRANFGQYTEHFLNGGYIGIGWIKDKNLSEVKTKEEIQKLYVERHPDEKSPNVIGQQVGQIARFLFDIQPGDYVITPDFNSEYLHYGIVKEEPYYYATEDDGCPYVHRKKVKWNKEVVQRKQFSVPFQNSIRSSLTIFLVKDRHNFFETIGKKEFVSQKIAVKESPEETVLRRILELDAKEFEILVTALLNALGFEAEHTGKVGDEGVDATGELDLYGLAKIKLFVQAKRYKADAKINAKQVRALRQNIKAGAQGAFITTANFQKDALQVAVESGFPRIGTINGSQLVDLLSEKWEDLELPEELKQKLALKRGLVIE